MAPPRQRTTAVQDDSRSEASSTTTTKELKAAAAKGRKGANVGNATAVSRDLKSTSNVTSAPATQGEQSDNLPRIPWSEMPLEFLHSYRHAYRLTCPSAHSSEYAHNLLSRGIGLLSPTAIAARRAQNHGSQQSDGSLKSHHNRSRPDGISGAPQNPFSKRSGPHNGRGALNHIISQDRVAKSQLATAVRKHFNSAGLVEQEAIARFLYKVREEGRGRHFRLKFQP